MHLTCHEVRPPTLPYYRSARHIWFLVCQIKTWPAIENAPSPYKLRVDTAESVSGFQDMHLVRHGKSLSPLPYYGLVWHLLPPLLDYGISSSLLRHWACNSVSNHGRLEIEIPPRKFRLSSNILYRSWRLERYRLPRPVLSLKQALLWPVIGMCIIVNYFYNGVSALRFKI